MQYTCAKQPNGNVTHITDMSDEVRWQYQLQPVAMLSPVWRSMP